MRFQGQRNPDKLEGRFFVAFDSLRFARASLQLGREGPYYIHIIHIFYTLNTYYIH